MLIFFKLSEVLRIILIFLSKLATHTYKRFCQFLISQQVSDAGNCHDDVSDKNALRLFPFHVAFVSMYRHFVIEMRYRESSITKQ